MERGRDPSDVIAVAQGEKREQRDGGVLRRVQASGEIQTRFRQPFLDPVRYVEPDGYGRERLWREVERLLAYDLLRERPLLLESQDGGGDVHPAPVRLRPSG